MGGLLYSKKRSSVQSAPESKVFFRVTKRFRRFKELLKPYELVKEKIIKIYTRLRSRVRKESGKGDKDE